MEIKQLITASTVVKMKKFNSIDAFLYHLKLPDTPKPVLIDGKKFWLKPEVEAWTPSHTRGRKSTKEVKNG